ncbi:hypothetical protein ACFSYC_05530 [Mucilaginibacter antarcticus]|uniref:GDSL-like lipase/acylhydrolase family protein n=2 Tax=Mucilaginibacter antarcticus TaxID=1855725 RepID=A0ABW5XKD6_9SPHI
MFNNVVILGNSITYSPQNPAIGWDGNWGMAATVPDSDYVHILTSRFLSKNPRVNVTAKNISWFEMDAKHYDFDLELKNLRDTKPELVIMRIGENVPPDVDLDMFEMRYVALLNYFRINNPKVVILAGTSVWGSAADSLMINHKPAVSLKKILADSSNFSYGLYSHPGIQAHPGNKGMHNVADVLWTKIMMLRLADSHDYK